ncbi:MAG: hypothetical protein IKI95_03795 [Clostridia bacterium]|nr:hypothetical protein [Clostridia bacterium]
MKITYRKLMHVACGQSLALGRLEAYLSIFNEFITKYANTEQLNEKNIRDFLKIFKKETKIAIKENGRIIDITEDLK